MRAFRRTLAFALFCSLLGCVNFLYLGSADETDALRPPRSWLSAVTFRLVDASIHDFAEHQTRIEFSDGMRTRVVTARDLIDVGTHKERTPWYRLRRLDTELRVTIVHPGGHITSAVYPLHVRDDGYYDVGVLIYHRRETGPRPVMAIEQEPRSYPLNPAAQAQPGDSLWISYFSYSKSCFDCPT